MKSLEFCEQSGNAGSSSSALDFCEESYVLDFCNEGQLTLTGTETPAYGDIYIAEGGTPPYVFSITQGQIDSSGMVSWISDACGSGVVKVTDSVGSTASITVRFALGEWSLIENFAAWLVYANCIGTWGNGGGNCYIYEGKFKYKYTYGCFPSFYNCQAPIANSKCPPELISPCIEGNDFLLRFSAKYEWVCP
jgi:hypothetical protein